jgi:hypothetical protein
MACRDALLVRRARRAAIGIERPLDAILDAPE